VLIQLFNCPPQGGGGGGGGGCINSGTAIPTPSGYVQVQDLRAGDSIYGYNTETSSLVSETVRNTTSNTSYAMVDVNNGELITTVYNQPLYVVNSTFTGWLRDPQNLTVGDLLWNALNGTWVPIGSLTYLSGQYTVYDVAATGAPDNYVAHSLLIESKFNG
jgi:hypothetical protein